MISKTLADSLSLKTYFIPYLYVLCLIPIFGGPKLSPQRTSTFESLSQLLKGIVRKPRRFESLRDIHYNSSQRCVKQWNLLTCTWSACWLWSMTKFHSFWEPVWLKKLLLTQQLNKFDFNAVETPMSNIPSWKIWENSATPRHVLQNIMRRVIVVGNMNIEEYLRGQVENSICKVLKCLDDVVWIGLLM